MTAAIDPAGVASTAPVGRVGRPAIAAPAGGSRCWRAAPWLAVLALLAACAGRPPSAPPAAATEAPPRSLAERTRDDYEMQLRAQAGVAMADRRWNEAALAWELLATLHPDDPLIAERLAESRRRNQAAIADLETRAEQAQRRGDADVAMQRWWSVLALDPTHAAAAAALRKLEGERTRKLYLGRHAGSTLTRRTIVEAEAIPTTTTNLRTAPPGATAAADIPGSAAPRPDLDRASALAADGQFDAAINLLEDRVALDRRDTAARRLLADVYAREADALDATDPQRARKARERRAQLAAAPPAAASRTRVVGSNKAGAARAASAASAATTERTSSRASRSGATL